MFCPDWMARILKAVEPIVETVPLSNILDAPNIILQPAMSSIAMKRVILTGATGSLVPI